MMQLEGYGPDGKAQVTVAFTDSGSFSHVALVLISIQHPESATNDEIRDAVLHKVIKPALGELLADQTEIIINPSGRFVSGGFEADAGLTGRKLMVDTYGGLAHHGGGAMSGKDPSKVDRSGAYMARYVANTIVQTRLATECEVSIAYAIGKPQPTMVEVNTFGSGEYPDERIAEAVRKTFDFTPTGITEKLQLKHTKYAQTAAHGHFGAEKDLPWERVVIGDAQRLRSAVEAEANNATSN